MAKLGEYELVRLIGRGGMGQVWMGRRVGLGGASKTVALKLLDPLRDDDGARERFLKEARVSMLLSHSNIVQVFDVGRDGDRLFLAMEWVDGVDLGRLVRAFREHGRRLTPSVAAYVVAELLRGLGYAHELDLGGSARGLVHRDVSPQNVLLSTSGEVKLADFGIARVSTDATTGTAIRGKLRYMAPDQVLGISGQATIDLYAVGAVFHELLDGRPFRHGRTDAQMLDDVCAGVVPHLHQSIDADLDAVRLSLLQADPTRRVATATEARTRVMAWSGYADASGELAALVKDLLGSDGPHSGCDGARPGVVPPRRGRGRSDVMPRHLEQTIAVEDTATRTDTARTRVEQAWDARARVVAGPSTKPDERAARDRIAWGPLGLGALGVALLGVAATRHFAQEQARSPGGRLAGVAAAATDSNQPSMMGSREGAPAPIVASARRRAASPSIAVPDKQGSPTSQLPARRDRPAAPEPLGKSRPTGDSSPSVAIERSRRDADADMAGARPTSTAPVDVLFKTGDFRFVYVRVDGGEALPLEPVRTVSLRPGSHRVEWRVAEHDDWRMAGRVRVRAGQSLIVRMRRDGTLSTQLAP